LFAEPFYTGKARRRGFGLAVAYGLLSAHHGGLSIANGPRGGAVARILLPVAAVATGLGQAGARDHQAATPDQRPAAHDEKVLVVDDDPMILQFVSTTLEEAGYRVLAVASADEAVDRYAAAGPDPFRLVLSDVVMPRGSGVDLARRLLNHDANARILFMSGQVSPDFARQDFAEHEFDLLSKPFRPEGLLRAVRGALDRPRPKAAVGSGS
jgi:CheY-like chemotaxis protein